MARASNGTFDVKSWDEKSLWDQPGTPKLTHASVTESLHGVIEGESALEYLMVYPSSTYAAFVGMQRVEGSVGGRSGSFMFRVEGIWENGTAQANFSVVPNTGSGQLAGLTGEGSYTSDNPQGGSFTFDYSFG